MQTERRDHPPALRLAAYAVGRLRADLVEAVREHLQQCGECTRYVKETPQAELVAMVREGRTKALADRNTHASGNSGTIPGIGGSISGTVPPAPGKATHAPPGVPQDLREQTKYRIVRLLGGGGMGSVYEAEHLLMRRPVAIKVINPQLTNHPQAVDRFVREIRAVSTIDHHENIVRAYDAETIGSLLAFIMELVPGHDLDKLAESRGPLPAAEACGYILQALAGLQHADAHQLVHRDIKPQNLILDSRTNKVRILDFGLAKALSETRQTRDLTMTRAAMGTFAYMAPEQALDAANADIRADIYSIGCTLYYLIAGALPFNHDTDGKLFLAHQTETPLPLDAVRPGTPAALADVVAWILAKKPEDRPQTPQEAMAALAPFAAGGTGARTADRLPRKTIHESRATGAGRRHQKSNRWSPAIAAAVVGVASACAVGLWRMSASQPQDDGVEQQAGAGLNAPPKPSILPTPQPAPADDADDAANGDAPVAAPLANLPPAEAAAPEPAPAGDPSPPTGDPSPRPTEAPRPAVNPPTLKGLAREVAFPAAPANGGSSDEDSVVELGPINDTTAPLLSVAIRQPQAMPLLGAKFSVAADEGSGERSWTIRVKALSPSEGNVNEGVAQLVLENGRLRLSRLASPHARLAGLLAFCTLVFRADQLSHEVRFEAEQWTCEVALTLDRRIQIYDVEEGIGPIGDDIRLQVQNIRLNGLDYDTVPRSGVIETGKQLTINVRSKKGSASLLFKLTRAGGKYTVLFTPRYRLGRNMPYLVIDEVQAMCDEMKQRLEDEQAIVDNVNAAIPEIESELEAAIFELDNAAAGENTTNLQQEINGLKAELKRENSAGKRAAGHIRDFNVQIPQLEAVIELGNLLRNGGALEFRVFAPLPDGEAAHRVVKRED